MSSHRRFAAAELKRTSPSPRVVSSESDDDVPEVSHPSQPRVASPRGDVVEGDDLRGVLDGLLREIGQKCLKRRRMRCRRVRVYSTGPRRPQGDLFDRD